MSSRHPVPLVLKNPHLPDFVRRSPVVEMKSIHGGFWTCQMAGTTCRLPGGKKGIVPPTCNTPFRTTLARSARAARSASKMHPSQISPMLLHRTRPLHFKKLASLMCSMATSMSRSITTQTAPCVPMQSVFHASALPIPSQPVPPIPVPATSTGSTANTAWASGILGMIRQRQSPLLLESMRI